MSFLSKQVLRFIGTVALIFATSPTHADVSSEPIWAVTIEDASAMPAPTGGISRIRLVIDNFTGQAVTLTGITSKQAETGALVLVFPSRGAQDVRQLTIEHDDELDFGTSHIRAELRGLKTTIKAGDLVEFALLLNGRAVPAAAHVH